MKVIKRDCTEAEFDKNKISSAILKAMKNGSGIVKPKIAEDIANEIFEDCKGIDEVSISDIEAMVYDKLITKKQRLTAKAYEGYRCVREFQRDNVNTIDEDITKLLDDNNEYWKSENANKNPMLNTTKRDYIAGIVSTDTSRRYILPPEIVQAHDEGIIHVHDMDYLIQYMNNCCVFNLEDMLQNGTVISGTLIEKPHSFSTACTITTQIIAQVASSQYGGQSISLAHLAPFVEVSRQKIFDEILFEQGVSKSDYLESLKTADKDVKCIRIEHAVERRLKQEITKGIQTIQYQLITLQTTNGQAPFVTIFMYLNEAKNEREKKDLALLIEEMLKQRIQGVKNEDGVFIAPAFPKLIYVTEDDNIHENSEYWYLTKLAAECSAKRLVPDYVSEKIMLELKGDVYPPMGCVGGDEIITYKVNGELYIESFSRMWNRLADFFEVKHQGGVADNPNLYIDVDNVQIYDNKKGFVDTYRIVRNISSNWVNVYLSNGRSLTCTSDHVFTTDDGVDKSAIELNNKDTIMVNHSPHLETSVAFNPDKAWLLGVILCNGRYQSGRLVVSIAATGEDEIEDKFRKELYRYFGLRSKTVLQERGERGDYKDLIAVSGQYDELAHAINYLTVKFGGVNKIKRHIPPDVFRWGMESKAAFMAGMIDADGHINKTQGGVVQIRSTNKELALQQMALAEALGMNAKIYHNHYSKGNPTAIRYRVEFYPSASVMSYIVCEKKRGNYANQHNAVNIKRNDCSCVVEVVPIEKTAYSYDVTTSSEHFSVSGIYSHNCRSFLTPDRFTDKGIGNIAKAKNYEQGKHKYYGRFNCGVVTLNLVDVALSSEKDINKFWELFESRTELCHKALKLRYERLKNTPADVSPILWRYGALARLDKGESIEKLLFNGYATVSLGYAGLYECVKYMTGCNISDGGKGEMFGLQVMQKLNDKCSQWKLEENIDYSLYGTPLESTTYKFAKKLKERFGDNVFITIDGHNRNYITNSYHIPVFEPIDAFEKLRIESKFQRLSPGGAISYIETPVMTNNTPALLQVIRYMYDNILYAEINTKSCYCEKCGYDGDIPLVDENGILKWKCPNCGNDDASTMDIAFRVCGYLGTAKNGGNQGRYGDIHDRVYHLDDVETEVLPRDMQV